MNRRERLALVDHDDPVLPVAVQYRLLRVGRSTLYYQPVPASPDDLAVMRRIDELHLEYSFYGSRRMTVVLRDDGWVVNRKRAQRLMRVMGLEAIYPPLCSIRHQRNVAIQDRICYYPYIG
jgi:putative transposase